MSTVRVHVHDTRGEALPRARVELVAEHESRALEPSSVLACHLARDVRPGRYRVRVTAEGCTPDEREIELGAGEASERFVLGPGDRAHYHEGRTRIPFERRDDLIGVTLEPGALEKDQARVREALGGLGWSPHPCEEADRAGSLRVYRGPPRTDAERAELAAVLRLDPAVARVGPLVECTPRRVKLLTDELIVRFHEHVTPGDAHALAERRGLVVTRRLPYAGNAYLLRTVRDVGYAILDAADALVKTGEVVYAEPNLIVTSPDLAVVPDDVLFSDQWHSALIGLPDAWQTLRDANPAGVGPGDPGDLTFGSASITIAMLDRGIESQTVAGSTTARHPEFAGTVTSGETKVAAFHDFATMSPDNDAPPNDHGMATAGVAAARAQNPSDVPGETEGCAGIAPECRVLGLIRAPDASFVRYADAYVWLAGFDPGWQPGTSGYPAGAVFPAPLAKGADVVNCSFQIPNSGLIGDAFDFLATYGRGGKGLVTVVAAGNVNQDVVADNPMAAHPRVVTVSASSDEDVKVFTSNHGLDVDVCAPSRQDVPVGPGLVTCELVGQGDIAGHSGGSLDYRDTFGQTSAAAPVVAGLAALMLSIRPELTWIQVREILRATAQTIDAGNTDPVGQWIDTTGDGVENFSRWYGWGRVDAAAAVVGARDFDASADLVIRDNPGDDGSVPSEGWHANSPDIWVRQGDDPIPNLAYTDAPPHENAMRGQPNHVYLRVKNAGTAPTLTAWLRALICHYPGFEFRYPDEWTPSGALGAPLPSPLVPGSYLIGEVEIGPLAPGADLIVKMPWASSRVPPREVDVDGMTVEWHPCLLADVTPHDGPAPAGATFDVKRDNNLAHKNITIVDAGSSASTGGMGSGAVAGSSDDSGVEALVLDGRDLPKGCEAWVWTPERALMAGWLERAVTGRVPAARPLAGEQGGAPPGGRPACRTTLLDDARLVLACGERRLVVHAKAGTTIDHGETGTAAVATGAVQDREVLVVAGGTGAIELPMRLPPRRWVPLVLGVRCPRGTRARGTLNATQRLGNDELSAGYTLVV